MAAKPAHPAGFYSVGNPRGSEEFTDRFGYNVPHNFLEDQLQQARTRTIQMAGTEVTASGSRRTPSGSGAVTPVGEFSGMSPKSLGSTLRSTTGMSPKSLGSTMRSTSQGGFGATPTGQQAASKWGWCLSRGNQFTPGIAQANLQQNMSLHLARPSSSPSLASPQHSMRADRMFAIKDGTMSNLPRLTGMIKTSNQLYGARHFDASPVDVTYKDKAAQRTRSDVVF